MPELPELQAKNARSCCPLTKVRVIRVLPNPGYIIWPIFDAMAGIPHIELFRKYRFRILLVVFIFWFLIGLFVYVTEVIVHKYFGMPFIDEVEQKQYALRWLLWLLLTPLIVFNALKINIGNTRVHWFVLIHIVLGTLILAAEFVAELLIIRPLAETIYKRTVLLDEMIVPFLYKYFAYIINYFLIIGIVNIWIYMHSLQLAQKNLLQTRLQNKDLKYQLALSELNALKTQIHPHFLFNTHNAILALIARNENDKAARMLNRLSDLLRLTTEKQQTEFIQLGDELRLADAYLEIQQVRFENRLTVSKTITTEAAQFTVPFFILQPVIENAVMHGIEKTDQPGVIAINAFVTADVLTVEVKNPGQLKHEPVKRPGIGMQNIRGRLHHYFGDAAVVTLAETGSGEIVVTLKIPAYGK